MYETTLSWKGSIKEPQGVAVYTYKDLSITVDLPCFEQAHRLHGFMSEALKRASSDRLKAATSSIRGMLDAIS